MVDCPLCGARVRVLKTRKMGPRSLHRPLVEHVGRDGATTCTWKSASQGG